MTTVNRQIRLAVNPVGMPRLSDFELDYCPVPSPHEGEVLVRSAYLSLDPFMRRLMGAAVPDPLQVCAGAVLAGGAVGYVVKSADAAFREGDAVAGMLGWQEFAIASARDLRKLDSGLDPLSVALGVLGTPGLTAYFGLLDICDPKPGETVVVSEASCGVGMLAGQIAKLRGCRVVGLTTSHGGDSGDSWLIDELGFDATLNCRSATDLDAALGSLCPGGIDAYFDSLGGTVTDAVLGQINPRARIALCGQTSQENLEEHELGPRWLERMIDRQAKVQGFDVSAYADHFPAALAQLAKWLQQGRLSYREDVAVGLESAPQAFIAMLQGRNQGKQLVQLLRP